jgi:hypothetical protein
VAAGEGDGREVRREKEGEEIVVLGVYMIKRNEAKTALCRQELIFVGLLFSFETIAFVTVLLSWLC